MKKFYCALESHSSVIREKHGIMIQTSEGLKIETEDNDQELIGVGIGPRNHEMGFPSTICVPTEEERKTLIDSNS